MKIPESILNTLTDEQKKKVEAAKSPEELLALAKESGQELTENRWKELPEVGVSIATITIA
jgi:hypothetical protein